MKNNRAKKKQYYQKKVRKYFDTDRKKNYGKCKMNKSENVNKLEWNFFNNRKKERKKTKPQHTMEHVGMSRIDSTHTLTL